MIHIMRIVCLDHHCMLAVAYEELPQRAVKAVLQARMDQLKRPPFCLVCGRALHFEACTTRFDSLEEVRPVLKQICEEQSCLTRN